MLEVKVGYLPPDQNFRMLRTSSNVDRRLEALVLKDLSSKALDLVSSFISDGMVNEAKLFDRSPEWVSGKLKKGEGVIVLRLEEDEYIPWDDNLELADFFVNHYAACAFLEKRDGIMLGRDLIEVCGVYTNPSLRRAANQVGPKIGAGTEAFVAAIMLSRQTFPKTAIVSWAHPMGSLQALKRAVDEDHLGLKLRLVPDNEFVGHEDILDPEHKPYEVV